MRSLRGVIMHYPWGTATAICDLLGIEPTGEPCAELWLGAHPSAPSGVDGVGLDDLIAGDPDAALGQELAAEFDSLPFLFKVLSAAEPLSLQAHPRAAAAEAGWEAENALGIPLDSPQRAFRDRSHKPELICALTEFKTLCGLRCPSATLGLLDALVDSACSSPGGSAGAAGDRAAGDRAAGDRAAGDRAVLVRIREMLRQDHSPAGLRGVLAFLLSADDPAGLVAAVRSACEALAMGHPDQPVGPGPHLGSDRDLQEAGQSADQRARCLQVCQEVAALGARHPDDPAVAAALLLNLVTLQPGEALALGAGTLHSHLRGTALEVMAGSDNVVRGGFTSKHVDIACLLEIADTVPCEPAVLRPEPVDGVAVYDSGVREFCLHRITPPGAGTVVEGPAILLCTSGSARLSPASRPSGGDVPAGQGAPPGAPVPQEMPGQTFERGQAVWIAASDPAVLLSGKATVFRAGVGAKRQ